MKEEVDSITEAFSMQPVCYMVGGYVSHTKIACIILEAINIPINGEPYTYQYYIGYDENGNKLFQFKQETVNVTFA